MDINEYISSGVLELYVAGALTPEATREVENIAERYAEVRNEIDEIQAVLEGIANADAHPRPALHGRIMRAVAQLERETPVGRILSISEHGGREQGAHAPALSVVWPRRARYLIAASLAFATLSAAAAGYFGYRWDKAEHDLAEAQVDNRRIVQRENTLRVRSEHLAANLDVLRSNPVRVVMKGTSIASRSEAVVYWDRATNRVRLDPGTLPAPPPGKQYQLWAIAGGAPADAGLFEAGDETGLVAMRQVWSAEAFAVTLEPAGGSATPTLDAMYASGRVESL